VAEATRSASDFVISPDENILRQYYDRRAAEYEEIYVPRDVDHGRELGVLARALRESLSGRRVLEVACGTGYWTGALSHAAREVVAIDASLPMLAEAREKGFPPHVRFLHGDAYDLASAGEGFDGALAMFWLSHVPRRRLGDFLGALHARLVPGARVFFGDNVYIPGLGGQFSGPDENGDTFKLRALADGSRHRVVKNYFTEDQLRELFAPRADELVLWRARYFWSATYQYRLATRG
jgi:SAM-dependent methyltransferase